MTNRPNLREFSHGGRRSGSENGILLSAGDSPLSGGFRITHLLAAENSQGEENARVLTRGTVGSRACAQSPRRSSPGSLVGFAAARKWSLRSLRFARQLAVPRRQRPGRIRLSPVRSPALGLALPVVAALPERHLFVFPVKPGTVLQ